MHVKYSLKQQQTLLYPMISQTCNQQINFQEINFSVNCHLIQQRKQCWNRSSLDVACPWVGIPTFADSVLTQENSGPISIYAQGACAVKAGRLSGPALVLHLSLELEIMYCEKPVEGNSLFLAMSFQVSRIPSHFNHCIRPADLVVLILVIKTAEGLPIQLEKPVQSF